jgi:hypothetical protein
MPIKPLEEWRYSGDHHFAERSPHRSGLTGWPRLLPGNKIKKYLNLKKRSLSIALLKNCGIKIKKNKLSADLQNKQSCCTASISNGLAIKHLDDFYYLAGSGQLIIMKSLSGS